ncbi:MAG: HNH endonuclease [Tannerellaceae bacterium]|jgi:hypothetical protein|nr:HNH endonuclease [Tannerellaceae bacterium]
MKKQPKYLLYASLLDAYQGYIGSDEIYNEYWGNAEHPQYTEDEFHEKQRLALIDRINRVPFDSEKADRGTAFNEIVDCIILHKKSDKMDIDIRKVEGFMHAEYNNRTHHFPIALCREFADYYRGATPQVLTEGILPTAYGDVLLYGYIDELMPTSVHDIKTTEKYAVGKFKSHWQHMVYPYCLNAEGNHVYDFEYNIAVLNETKYAYNYETFTEYYNYVPEVDVPRLTAHVEGLVRFIELHREVITDKKIFNL